MNNWDLKEAYSWGFNCGPGALCAVTDKTPKEIRPFLGDFEDKRYIDYESMVGILKRMNIKHKVIDSFDWPDFGLIRIQWGGPWKHKTRHSHWIGYDQINYNSKRVFDVNALNVGGWIHYNIWQNKLVPWLLKAVEPEANGKWWITHSIEVF